MEEAFDEYFPSEGPDKEWGRGRGPGCFAGNLWRNLVSQLFDLL